MAKTGSLVNIAVGWKQNTTQFLNVYWNFESTARQLFQPLSRESSPPPDATSSCFCVNFLDCCPQLIQKQQTLLICGLYTYSRTRPSSPFPVRFRQIQCELFQNNSHLSSLRPLYKKAHSIPRWWTCLSSPFAGSLGSVPQEVKPFFEDKIQPSKFCLYYFPV